MTQYIKQITLAIVLFISCSSFFILSEPETKIFGVSENDPSQIELSLESNNHFTYQDYSDPNNKIDVQGVWKRTKNHIQLSADNTDQNFHTQWKISKDGNTVKSRNKMCFYTLKRLN